MTASSNRTNEDLLKRAKYGGRNLVGLAILITLMAGLSSVAVLVLPGKEILWFAAPIYILAISYWCLASAARRGNQSAIGVVIGFLAVQFVLSVILQVFVYIRTNGAQPLNIIWIAIPLLIIFALSRNRTDLLELRNRGLWEFVFGSNASPTNRLCTIGGFLMFVGYVALYVGLLMPAIYAARTARLRQDFVNLIKVDDADFMDSFKHFSESKDPSKFKDVLSKIDILEQKAEKLVQDASNESVLQPIFSSYLAATKDWQDGLHAIENVGVASQQAISKLTEGDKLRQEALSAYDKTVPSAQTRQQ